MIIRPALPEMAPFLHLYVISPLFQAMIDSVQVGISRDGLSNQSVLRTVLSPRMPQAIAATSAKNL